jgi:hypothetical protein
MIIKKDYQVNSLLLYQGVLTVNLISILGNYIRSFLNHDPKVLQRIFKIFIELAQNVSYYSAEMIDVRGGVPCGTGWVSVQELQDHYLVTTANVIKPEDGPKLISYCREINSKNAEELRLLKRNTRSQAMERETGAHIGLIQTSILSGNHLEFDVSPGDDSRPVFTISTRVNKA